MMCVAVNIIYIHLAVYFLYVTVSTECVHYDIDGVLFSLVYFIRLFV